MPAPERRRYHAPIRAEQAAATRARILAAAAEVFTAGGWSGATVADIARTAGVTPQAVHLSVGPKAALLVESVRDVVGGAQMDVPLVDREPFRSAYEPGVPLRDRAAAFAAGSADVYRRSGRLFLVLAEAAPQDDSVAQLWQGAKARRLVDCRRLVRSVGTWSRGEARRRSDLLFVYSGPGMYADLTGDRGWSDAAYREWLASSVETLLAPR